MSSDASRVASSLSTESAASSSIWDKISTWASEHKAVVYTVAGVAVVVSATGAIYYLSDSRAAHHPGHEKKRPSKKERRKAKQEKEKDVPNDDAQTAARDASKVATVEADPLEDIPLIDETTVEGFSVEVRTIHTQSRATMLI